MKSRINIGGNTIMISLLIVAGTSIIVLLASRGLVINYKEIRISKIISRLENKYNAKKTPLSYGKPYRLIIPSLLLVSEVEQVGKTSRGAMGVPLNIAHVAWYMLGPRPGEVGNAVISGHYGWVDNKVSAFDKLSEIKIGDSIYGEDENGSHALFIVRKIKTYDKDAPTDEVFASSDGKAHLNLITCHGAWNEEDSEYTRRLVIFADLKEK